MDCPEVWVNPANLYLFKTNNRNFSKRCEVCSKLIKKLRNNVVNVALLFSLLTLNILHTFYSVSIVDFEHVNVSWEAGFMRNAFSQSWVEYGSIGYCSNKNLN